MQRSMGMALTLISLGCTAPLRAQDSTATRVAQPLNQYLIRLQPARLGQLTDPTPEEKARVSEHFRYHQRLTQEGTDILSGRTQNADSTMFGIVIFEAANDAEARKIMESDPAVRAGVMTAKLFPYRIALMRER